MDVLFIQTGGSIDKDYPRKIKGYNFEITKPAVKRILQIIQPSFSYKILSACRKDSLDLTRKDRGKIKKYCEQTNYKKIIITHGTDTMLQTAKTLSQIINKTIILTGSLIPERFKDSDAMFNIGLAIGAIQYLPYGIYIAMHSDIMIWNKCKRDIKSGHFVKA